MAQRIAAIAVLTVILPTGCGAPGASRDQEAFEDASRAEAHAAFSDASSSIGLEFLHHNGMTGSMSFVEMMGPGGGMLDYDADGDLDLYLLQGTDLDESVMADGGGTGQCSDGSPGDRLYRNDLAFDPRGRPVVRLVDVTSESGIEACGYGMGVAAGDIDNDGWTDLYVTNWGDNQLWRNNGDGTFSDITEISDAGDRGWGTSAAFFDFDRDGWLDLYVANYVEYNSGTDVPCYGPSSARDYCAPTAYPSQTDRLFRNLGGGRFEDVSVRSGIASKSRYGLGVASADFNRDGLVDLYVANDRQENFLWINQGDGTFVDRSLLSGCAVNRDGMAEASMGVDTADFDGDGDEDIVLAHLDGESNTVYSNDGHGRFEDRTTSLKIAGPSLPFTTFGLRWVDYDNDGLLDLFAANGAVIVIPELAATGDPLPLHQQNQLFHREPEGVYKDAGAAAGPALALSEVSRGVADGDIDNDGDVDLLLINNNGPARLLLNNRGQDQNWIGFRIVGVGGRDMLGAEVVLRRAGTTLATRRVRTDGSYCSSRDARILIGLGESAAPVEAVVSWPDGSSESWAELGTGKYWTLVQGRSGALPGPSEGTTK